MNRSGLRTRRGGRWTQRWPGRNILAGGNESDLRLRWDNCFNTITLLSPAMCETFIMSQLKELITGYDGMGFFTIKRTDGNIMPIPDTLMVVNPHGCHSLDSQGGVDLAWVKRRVGDRLCLIGNVNCALPQTGSEAEVIAHSRRALTQGMPVVGYVLGIGN